MTPEQQQFLSSLSREQVQAFAQMSDAQKSAIYTSYLQSRGGGSRLNSSQSSQSINNLLSYATNTFGGEGLKYVQDHYNILNSDFNSSGANGALNALSSYLGTGGDTDQALQSGLTSFGLGYANKTAQDWITNFAKSRGQETFDNALLTSGPDAAQIAGRLKADNWGMGLNAGATGAITGLGTYLATGDAEEGLKAGGTTAGKSLLTDYAGKYVAEQAYSKAIASGATKTAAQLAAEQAASAFVPVVGGVVGGVMGAFSGGTSKEKTTSAMSGAINGTMTAVAPYMMAAMEGMKLLGKYVSGNSSEAAKVGVTFNAVTGQFTYDKGSGKGNTRQSFQDLSPELRQSLQGELVREAKDRYDKFLEVKTDDREGLARVLGGSYFNPSIKIDENDMGRWKAAGGYVNDIDAGETDLQYMSRKTEWDKNEDHTNIGSFREQRTESSVDPYVSREGFSLDAALNLMNHNKKYGTNHTMDMLHTAISEEWVSDEDNYRVGGDLSIRDVAKGTDKHEVEEEPSINMPTIQEPYISWR